LLAEYGIFVVLFVLVLVLAIATPLLRGQQFFLTPRNLLQVGLQAAVNLVIAIGMTFVIISGGIDLSVGSIVALSGLSAALGMQAGASPWVGLTLAIAVGGACGLFNGAFITRMNLQPFIVTLGTMGIFRGLALVLSNGRPVYQFTPAFLQLFAGFVGPFPVQLLIALIVLAACWWLLVTTRFGKYTFAIGGNEEAARLAGIDIKTHLLKVYLLAGLLTGLAAALLTARLSSADPTAGIGFELDAIAATIMGGTSLTGGAGSVLGTLVGALIISLVRNGMNILNVPAFWQQFVIGWVIILAVMLDRWRRQPAT
jgi:ribose/xylose/arabinose/galactoside ABC-type transport system permease subunit